MEDAVGFPLNCGTINTSGEYSFDKNGIGTSDFSLESTQIVRTIVSGTETSRTTQDLNLIDVTSATTITDFSISPNWNITPEQIYDLEYTSLNSGVILAPGDNSVASGVSSGSTAIKAFKSDDEEVFKTIDLTVASGAGSSFTSLDSYVSGSLSYEVSDQVDTRAQAVTNASSQTPLFSSVNHGTSSYTRNTSIWTTNVDLTCISPWNSNAGQNKAGTLITSKHIIFAAHYQYPIGTTVRFVSSSNVVYDRTLTAKASVTKQGYSTDITIGKLSSDVGSGVSFAKVLDTTNIATRFPNLGDNTGDEEYPVPCIYLRQDNNIYCADQQGNLQDQIVFDGTRQAFYGIRTPVDSDRLALYSGVRSGDSGGPCFLIINNEAVLLGCWYFPTSGPHAAWYTTEINNIIQNTFGDTGYSVSTYDISSYNSY